MYLNILDRSCETCVRLWRDYSDATTAHVRLDSKLQIAALSHDAEAIEQLTVSVEEAAIVRQTAREAIRMHESAEHH